ncbi:PRC and DUF2382 domain-containing protein [Pseudonocardia pini]|uniref:PRC and DUF2382 domain-containing protein n=1 Tax=Pseudonocardia pini TaxID=2758030 RepID=UPI0015F0A4C7|nr:PRC and DUF2382 domain-containing protein [Pseudonocardia pini]
MTLNITDPSTLYGKAVIGRDGEKLGKVDGVYLDNDTQRPEWAAVKSGLFGSHVSLVPLATADTAGDDLRVPFDKEALSSAPHHDPERELSPQDEVELFEHYGVSYGGETVTAQTGDQTRTGSENQQFGAGERTFDHDSDRVDTAVGRDTSGPTTDDAMTRSEERMRVGTETTEVGRARLRKYVVTENVTQTVPVSHEEVRIEREPITEASVGDAVDGPSISEEEHEVTLHAERPVTQTEAVPVERVRIGKETVTEHEKVSGEVRKEQIESSGVEETDR